MPRSAASVPRRARVPYGLRMWSLDRRVAASAVRRRGPGAGDPDRGRRRARATGPAASPSISPASWPRSRTAAAARLGWSPTRFTRYQRGGNQLHDTIVVAHVAASAGRPRSTSTTVSARSSSPPAIARYSCTVPDDKPECLERPTVDRTSRPGAVYGGAVASGRYDIVGRRVGADRRARRAVLRPAAAAGLARARPRILVGAVLFERRRAPAIAGAGLDRDRRTPRDSPCGARSDAPTCCRCSRRTGWNASRPSAVATRRPSLDTLRRRELLRRGAARAGRRRSAPRSSSRTRGRWCAAGRRRGRGAAHGCPCARRKPGAGIPP